MRSRKRKSQNISFINLDVEQYKYIISKLVNNKVVKFLGEEDINFERLVVVKRIMASKERLASQKKAYL